MADELAKDRCDAPAGQGGPATSGGQALLERLLAPRNRIGRTLVRLEQVKTGIAAGRPKAEVTPETSAGKVTSFFEALEALAEEFERLADELDASVSDLAGMF
jgi:HAMP domain-containing protein